MYIPEPIPMISWRVSITWKVVARIVPHYLVVGEDVPIHRSVGSEPFRFLDNGHGDWEWVRRWNLVLGD